MMEEPVTVVQTAHMTDLGNSRVFVDAFGRDLRWCGAMPGTGWMVWSGSHWQTDDTKQVQRFATQVADLWREAAPPEPDDTMGLTEEAEKQRKRREAMMKHANRCESASSVRALVELASADSRIAVKKEVWDADLWSFSTPKTTYNLHNMTMHRPRREDYATRQARVSAGGQGCPEWLEFLDTIMGGDAALVAFLQRAVGYCLTGSIKEQCMFIAYGRGANGKSTFMDTINYILGDYATTTAVETFVGRREGAIPNDLAALAGARLVTCSETGEGGGLDEALVKLVTGGDPITARFLNREFFNFIPAFKLWMLTNHKPIVKGTDEGIWRRLRMIPFTVTIPKEQRDKGLPERLRAEAPGILQWALEGLKEWRRIGLSPPEAVTKATEDYKQEMDILADFLLDCCTLDPALKITNKRLYAIYTSWAKDNGLTPRSHKWFSRALIDRGYQQDAGRSDGRSWCGIGPASN
jgi:putative DNA primase/helicase